jgi:hypothetical protein
MTTEPHTTKDVPAASFFKNLNGAVRDNPIAAGAIGVGVLWMLFGSSKLSRLGGSVIDASQSTAGAVGSGARTLAKNVGDGIAATGMRAGEIAQDAGNTVKSGVQNADSIARNAMDTASNIFSKQGQGGTDLTGPATSSLTDTLTSSATSVRKNLSIALERQPLLLGVIGLAVGAGIAATFASTQTEDELVGERAARLRDDVAELAADKADFVRTRAKQVLEEVGKEAAAQGLTPAAAKDQFKSVAEKIKTVAATTRGTVKDRLS